MTPEPSMTPEQHLIEDWHDGEAQGDLSNAVSSIEYVLPMLDEGIERDTLQLLVSSEKPQEHKWGRFDTLPVMRWDVSSKRMVLLNDLTFYSAWGTYVARKGLVTDGLSYPWWSLSIVGGRFEGRSRFAALIHDQLCHDGRHGTSPIDSKAVHHMFYVAMRACGVQWFGAWIRWKAVLLFGNRFKKGTPL